MERSDGTYRLSGLLLAAGSVVLFVGTLFYIRLTPELGLPATVADRMHALADARALGPQPMALAGGFAFFGDVLLTAACIALLTRRRLPGSDLEPFGWTLVAIGAANAMLFDSSMAVLLSPLAQLADPGAFLAFKGWFDFLFAAGNVPFGDAASTAGARRLRDRRRRRGIGERLGLRDGGDGRTTCDRPHRHAGLRRVRRARRADRTPGGHGDVASVSSGEPRVAHLNAEDSRCASD